MQFRHSFWNTYTPAHAGSLMRCMWWEGIGRAGRVTHSQTAGDSESRVLGDVKAGGGLQEIRVPLSSRSQALAPYQYIEFKLPSTSAWAAGLGPAFSLGIKPLMLHPDLFLKGSVKGSSCPGTRTTNFCRKAGFGVLGWPAREPGRQPTIENLTRPCIRREIFLPSNTVAGSIRGRVRLTDIPVTQLVQYSQCQTIFPSSVILHVYMCMY